MASEISKHLSAPVLFISDNILRGHSMYSITGLFSRKVFLVAILINLTALSFTSIAEQKISESIEADPIGTVLIEHVVGKANISGWDKNEVSVQGTLGDRTDKVKFERNGKSVQLIIEVKNKQNWSDWSSSQGDDLTIRVPINSKVNYTSVNADASISSIYGGIDAEVVNGDVNASDLKGRVRLESVNGDIRAEKISGQLKIETVNGSIKAKQNDTKDLFLSTVNGDIDAHSDSTQINAESVNGDIELTLSKVDEAEFTTVNGAIEVSMHLNAGGDVRASSVGGSIALSFQESIAAKFDIEAHAGGSIKNNITNDKVEKAKYGPRRSLTFSTPNPTASVDVSTVHGRVIVKTEK